MLAAIRQAKATARDRTWSVRGELTGVELPASRAAGKTIGEVVIDLDATLGTAHSDKESAKGNFKGGFGCHPLGAWLDNTGEALAAVLRPGNAGSNTAADHLTVIDMALAQLPDRWRDKPILIRADGAGSSHALIAALSKQGLEFSVCYPVTTLSGTPSRRSRSGRGRSPATPTGICVSTLMSWRSSTCST